LSAAIVVIMIGRNRIKQPSLIASSAVRPSRSRTSAKSTIMIAFFFTIPISKMIPIMLMIDRSCPERKSASRAPTPADGSVEMIVNG
jgi:hypothetical protein